jgi:hypothetical protein
MHSTAQSPSIDVVLPVVLNEQQISPFKFYWEQTVREGMMYAAEIYGVAYELGSGHRLHAYQLACELMAQGWSAVVTVSQSRYLVWLSVRSPFFTQCGNEAIATAQG